jgi:hypothetical protein
MRGYAQSYAAARPGVSWLLALYLIAGGIVAATQAAGHAKAAVKKAT